MGVGADLLNALGPGGRVRVLYNPQPSLPNAAAAGSLGGGDVQPVAGPIELTVRAENGATGQSESGALAGRSVDVRLPVLVSCPPGAQFAWLVELSRSGEFLGYLRLPATYDPATNSLVYRLPADALDGTLFLPVCVGRAWVMNHDPGARIWSGPTPDAVDFGIAAPQWTRMTVVGPQVRGRLFVFNPFTANYGWIDAAGVGPVGPPEAAAA